MTDQHDGNRREKPSEAIAPGLDVPVCETCADTSSEYVMDRAEALSVLHLDEKANAYAIDERFWQLTKRYRREKNDEMLAQITAAYDVASGRFAQK